MLVRNSLNLSNSIYKNVVSQKALKRSYKLQLILLMTRLRYGIPKA